ncbi:MAG: HAMP domain-containing histidine kinase [Deltaproteobacteria bacterium]|nr:HAMP domain-containing histidine kinase [Deltaproteobacteria bacterium]
MTLPVLTIRVRLMLASIVPLLGITAALAFLSYRVASTGMEEELGQRLVTAAGAGAALPGIEYAFDLVPGEEGSRRYANVLAKLDALRKTTTVRSIILLEREGKVLVPSGGAYRIGDRLHRLAFDATEFKSAVAGVPAASVMFEGRDGAMYKAAYAPVIDPDTKEIRGVVAVEGAARQFELLGAMKEQFVAIAIAGVLLMAVAMFFVARMITRPVSDLAAAARAIGRGDLATPVAVRGSDEVGFLGKTMEEMRAEIEGRDRHMQMMLSGVAHEIRNPLGGMELFTGLLREDTEGNEEAQKKVVRIERELQYLTTVVNSFLDYTRRTVPDPREFDPRPVLEDVRWSVIRDAEAREIELVFDCAGPAVRCDPEGFKRAALNLVRNAVQATGKGGRVKVTLSCGDGGFDLAVDDTGSGIPAEKFSEVFKPFFTTRERGTGLGLAFVKKFADEHAGTVEVRSEPGKGSTFVVKIPV